MTVIHISYSTYPTEYEKHRNIMNRIKVLYTICVKDFLHHQSITKRHVIKKFDFTSIHLKVTYTIVFDWLTIQKILHTVHTH